MASSTDGAPRITEIHLAVSPPDDIDNNVVKDQIVSPHSNYDPSSSGNKTLCTHAFAVGSRVIHYQQQWTIHLHDTVLVVTSNRSGSVIVAATASGRVFLLRGSDGAVLASHSITATGSSAEDAWNVDLMGPPTIAWIPAVGDNNDNDHDAFWIEAGGVMASENDEQRYIFVSNIQGELLNSDDSSVTAQAMQTMKMTTIFLPSSTWRASVGYFSSETSGCYELSTPRVIRIVACDDDGSLAVYDHDLRTQSTTLIRQKIVLQVQANDDWCVDYELGLRTIKFRNKIYVLVVGSTSHRTNLYWFDPVSFESACAFAVELEEDKRNTNTAVISMGRQRQTTSMMRPKVLAMAPLLSLPSNETLAVGLAVSTSSNEQVKIQVVRVLTEDTFGLTLLSKPHVLYEIPVDNPVCGVELATAAADFGAFSFTYKIWLDATTVRCFNFTCGASGEILGKLRMLLELEDFDKLETTMASEDTGRALSDPMAVFSPFEVAWRELQSVLLRGSIGNQQSIRRAQMCLHRLTEGATKGHSGAVNYLVQAADFCTSALPNPTLAEMTFVLNALVSSLEQVWGGFVGEQSVIEQVKLQHQQLRNRVIALDFLKSAVQGEEGHESLLLTSYLKSIRSPRHLFSLLMEHQHFVVAEQLCRSKLRSFLTPQVLVESLLKTPSELCPRRYVHILSDIIFPSLSIGHELLSPLRSWVCRTADTLDEGQDDNGLADAMLLLEAACRSLNVLQLQVHESFAVSSPFRALEKNQFVKRVPRGVNKINSLLHLSRDSDGNDDGGSTEHTKATSASAFRSIGGGMRPTPTLLQLGVLERGAITTRVSSANPADCNYENDDECMDNKLKEARCLHRARLAGLDKEKVTLKCLAEHGGPPFVALALVAHFSRAAEDHDKRLDNMSKYLRRFCLEFKIDYDSVLLDYIRSRCRGNNASVNAITESGSLARCCQSAEKKAEASLIVLQSALVCGHFLDWLADLATDAKSWASFDSEEQSKIQEAWRLLSIMSVVVKYTGSAARDVFRVDNPRHAIRLMDYVTQHVHGKDVLDDVFVLCNAFLHLDLRDNCRALTQNAILRGDDLLCRRLLTILFTRDISLGESVFVGAISFIEELLVECATKLKLSTLVDKVLVAETLWIRAIECATAVVTVALAFIRTVSIAGASELWSLLNNGSIECLRADLHRLCRLQAESSIFLSFSDLHSPTHVVGTIAGLLLPVIQAHVDSEIELLVNKVAIARRACSLMVKGSKGDVDDVWMWVCADVAVKLIHGHRDSNLLDLLQSLGLLQQTLNSPSARAQLSVALAFCAEARSKCVDDVNDCMSRLIKAAILVRDYALVSTSTRDLAAATSLSAVVDIACEILTRGDEGVGERLVQLRNNLEVNVWKKRLPPSIQLTMANKTVQLPSSMCRPVLRRHWYVGDGLLLPPNESLDRSLHLCNGLLRNDFSDVRYAIDFIQLSGANSLVLRLLCACTSRFVGSVALRGSLHEAFDTMACGFDEVTGLLAERSLGGSCHTGMTSSIVDSELSAACLLSLPPKGAVEIYKASLPTALKTKDFDRAYALANVGSIVCRWENDPLSDLGCFFAIGWKGRERFYLPCQQLAFRSLWWSILADYGVEYETSRFEATRDKVNTQYIKSLLISLVKGMSEKLDMLVVLKGCFAFATTFGIGQDCVLREHVRYLLTVDINILSLLDSRSSISVCEKLARRSLRMLQSSLARCEILRECLCHLEHSRSNYQHYERLSLVLSLYQEALEYVLDQEPYLMSADVSGFEKDFENVRRRRDALAILSSIFYGERVHERPPFPLFFIPIDTPAERLRQFTFCGVLGKHGVADENVFDPLEPLEAILSNEANTVPVASLGPLCLPLGLPVGYIHARGLLQKFLKARLGTTSSPSFENEIVAVVERLRSPKDQFQLLEWCSKQYSDSEEDQLKCLEMAHSAAILASDAIEMKRRCSADQSRFEQAEDEALSVLKQLDSAKAALSDRLRVKSILQAGLLETQDAISCVTEKLDAQLSKEVMVDSSPENLVRALLANASLLAAEACLDVENPLSMEQFRQVRSTVSEACRSVTDQYSHIDLLGECKRLAWRWLFHGAESLEEIFKDGPDMSRDRQVSANAVQRALVDNETVDFVMDLSDLLTGDDQRHAAVARKNSTHFTSDEEPSAVKPVSSRELSEMECRREALRVAFVLSFDDTAEIIPAISDDIENRGPFGNKTTTNRRSGLLNKIDTKRENPQEVMITKISRWLLTIVFAKSGQTSAQLYGDASFADTMDSHLHGMAGLATVTFAMRHRALRTAAVLCPQETLERVILDHDFLHKTSKTNGVSLQDCTFASFVAKEIEEMGLPLPHSDLDRLASMQYTSYARTLWRHHRDDNKTGQKGRLLLLLIEMSLKGELADMALVSTLLEEMCRLHLPRSLLLAIERIVFYEARHGYQPKLRGPFLSLSIETAAKAIFSEAHRNFGPTEVDDKDSLTNCVESIRRLGDALISLNSSSDGQTQLQQYADVLGNLTEAPLPSDMSKTLNSILLNATRRLGRQIRDKKLESDFDDAGRSQTLADALARFETSLT